MTHARIKVSHLLDDGHRSVLLYLCPLFLVLALRRLANEIFAVYECRRSCNSRRLLNHNGCRHKHRRLLEESRKLVEDICRGINSCTSVKILKELVDVFHRTVSVCASQVGNHTHRIQFLVVWRTVVIYPVKVLKR